MLSRRCPGAVLAVPTLGDPAKSRLLRIRGVLQEEARGLRPRLRAVNLLGSLLPYHTFARLRTVLYRFTGVRIGSSTALLGRIDFGGTNPLSSLRIGEHCIINAPMFFDLNAPITIGNHVLIGHHTTLITAEHEIGPSGRRGGCLKPAAIFIEDGCLIGAMVTILPGVRIGSGAIVATGSVVSADVPPNKLVAGNPARVIKTLPDDLS